MGISETTGPRPGERTGPADQPGPTVPRLILGSRLRRLRLDLGISRESAAARIGSSTSKISRLELGRTGCKPRDLTGLLGLYGVTDEAERADLLTLAGQANTPGWWQPYCDVVPDWYQDFLGFEQAAAVIRTYDVQAVPELLQTPEYADAVIRLAHRADPPEILARRAEVRLLRQQILHRAASAPPQLWTVIDEAVLHRAVGGPRTMRAQLSHLLAMCELPHVTVQVLPLRNGGCATGAAPVTLLRLPGGELPDIAYLEQLSSAVYFDRPADTDPYAELLSHLVVEAATPEESRHLVERARAAL
ncbi:helix-turn-helix transcriptional regulator [Streptomyces sp. YIM 98790]|uniref:helix-turn-helix domain-containing protein n=1 Tax=Streptomyces sp. YIM 98790 TaxID=2689077 RepID=UPI0014099A12|nr:helix-turn-helix transcriptional regulator [Streptomyces sp. YIM 98790]